MLFSNWANLIEILITGSLLSLFSTELKNRFLWDTDIKIDLYCNSSEHKLNTRTKCLPHLNKSKRPSSWHWGATLKPKSVVNKFCYNYRAIQSVVTLDTKQYKTGTIMPQKLKISSGRAFLKFEQMNSGSAVPMYGLVKCRDFNHCFSRVLFTSQSCTTLTRYFPMFLF